MRDEEMDRGQGDPMRSLLQDAGPRPLIPRGDLEAIRSEARKVWRARYVEERRAGPRWGLVLPLAATLCAAVFLAWWFGARPAENVPLPVVAQIESSRGPSPFSPGQQLRAGAAIETDEKVWLSLGLAGGQSLRLDEGTRVRLISADSISLERGGVYLDSLNGAPVTIATFAGDFVPAGTQFELRLVGNGVQLRVREGQVVLNQKNGADSAVTRAGEQLVVQPDGALHRGEIGRSHADWDWVLAAARVPEIEGQTLLSFVRWMARERGWNVEFDSIEAEQLSREVTLHGSVSEMSPADALNTVMLSSGFSHQVSNGTLRVSRP